MMKNTKKIISAIVGAVVSLPALVLAQATYPSEPSNTVNNLPKLMSDITTPIWEIFIGLSVVMIIVAAFLFITSTGQPEKVSQARMAAIWAVVGILVAVVAYSIPFVLVGFIK